MGTNSINRLIAAELSALAYTPATIDQVTMTKYDNLEGWTDVTVATTVARVTSSQKVLLPTCF